MEHRHIGCREKIDAYADADAVGTVSAWEPLAKFHPDESHTYAVRKLYFGSQTYCP